MTRRGLDPLAPVPATDPLAQRVLELPLYALPAAGEQLRALPDVFTFTRVRLPGGGPSALQSARLPVNLIGSSINYANRLIGPPINSQSTGQHDTQIQVSCHHSKMA